MSSSQSREVLFSSISLSSCLTELLYVIRLSFDSEKIKEAERILILREEEFRSQVRDLKTEVENLQKERNLLVLTQLEKISLEKDFEKCEAKRKELNERVNRLVEEAGSLIVSKIQAEERYMNAMEVSKRVESEGRKNTQELMWKIEKLKEEILRYQDHHQLEKISLEKDFEKCETERKELNERVNRLVEERGSLIDSKIQAEERCMNAMEVCKRVESEGRKNMQELMWKIEKLKEEFMRYQYDHQHKEVETGKVLITQPIKRGFEWFQSTSYLSDKQLAKRIRTDEGEFSPTVEVSEPSRELTTTAEMIILPSAMGPLKVHPHSDRYITKEAVQSIPHFINKEIIQEEGMEPTLVPYYARLMQWNWGQLLGQPEYYAEHLIREFFCNARHSPNKAEISVYCRGCVVCISPPLINQYLGTASIPREQDPPVQLQDRGIGVRDEILDALALPGTVWPILKQRHKQFLGQFMESRYRTTSMKVLHRWVTKTLVPLGDPSVVTFFSALVCYCIHMDRRFDVGRLIYAGIRRMTRASKKKVLGFPHLITSLCRRVNVCIDEATRLKQLPKPALGTSCGAAQEDRQQDQAPAMPPAPEPPKLAAGMSCGASQDDSQEDQTPVVPPASKPPKPAAGMGCGAAQDDSQEDQTPVVPPASEPPKPAAGMGCGAAQDDSQEDQAPVVPPAPEPPKPVVGMGCDVAPEDPLEDQAPSVPLAPEPGPSAAPELADPPASDILATSPST